MGDIDLARPLLTLPLINCNRRLGEMVRPKAKMSYRDYEENGASEGESYQGGDSEEDFSDAPPAKKKKASAKKKVKKSKKSKKKSKYTADSDEDDMIAELSDDDTAPATWRPGGPVVEAKTAPTKKYIYKDASDQDFTDDGEIDDAADSDFDVGVKAPPKKRSPKKTPSKKSPVKNGKKKTPAKAATNGTTPRASGRANAKKTYVEDDEDDIEEDSDDIEDEVPLKARKVAKQAKGRAAAVKKET